jgi:hypothetical protein
VVAMGVDVYVAASYTTTYDTAGYSLANGTSFSCPLTAGVCALILSVHPELTPDQVADALRNTADKKDNPNNTYGWGLVNSYEAVLYHGMIISNKPEIEYIGDNTAVSIYVISKKAVDESSVKMYYSINGSEFNTLLMGITERTGENSSGRYSVSVPFDPVSGNVKFYFTAGDSEMSKTLPYNAPEKFFYFNSETKNLEIY